MSYQIKQSTTAYPLVFLMIDSADHISAKTGLTPAVTLSKAGAAFASPSGAVSEIANGWYKVAGNATDSGTLGPLILHASATGADATDMIFEVVAFDPQDAVRLGLTALPNVASGSAGAIVTSGTGTAQLSVTSGLVTLAAVTHTGAVIPTVTTTTTATNLTNAPTNGDLTATMKTSVTTAATAATPVAASVTGNVGGNVVGSVASVTAAVSVTGDLSATMKTSVTTACTASTPIAASVTGAVGSVTGNVGGNVVGSVASVTAVSANAIGATSISAAGLNAIADGVLDRNMATGTDSGTDSTSVRTPRQAWRATRNKVSIAAGTMTVNKEDDTTASWTAAVTTTAGNPVSAVDPT